MALKDFFFPEQLMTQNFPFLFGSQYYRAPTPDSTCWENDLHRMRRLGMNAVKFWVQWRWSHRLGDNLVFDDVDRLMDLAAANHLQVTLNTIFDVAPHWLYQKYPDAKQVMNNGRMIEPYVVAHRQIGGHPGPCYTHPGALLERQKFMQAAILHFKDFPALAMWDVWNEPEISFPQRSPHIDTLVCYCPHCQAAFLAWLQKKYASIEELNRIWGRCYESWEQVEVPRSTQVFTDFIDWREFHIDTMTMESQWRLEMVRLLDPTRLRYLHVVPNVMTVWNSISCCSDDFAMAKDCQVFASTMNGGPILAQQVLSAARGKPAYNVESHINFGHTGMHQRVLSLEDLLHDWLPQIGLGIRGFLFWQFRAETLGWESPAWGVVNPDGSDRPVTQAVETFWRTLQPHTELLLACPAPKPQIGIWKSRKNEIFHFCAQQGVQDLAEDVDAYIDALYWHNFSYRIIDGSMLAEGDLDDLKLLIMPSPYLLTAAEADSLDRWVRAGGVLLAEAHLGGYNAATGRHSSRIPGLGLAESWGFREIDSTSSYHLKLEHAEAFAGASPEDVRKALAGQSTTGGRHYPIKTASGTLWGALRYARLEGEGLESLGVFDSGSSCLATKKIGQGRVIYSAANLGSAAAKNPAGFVAFLRTVVDWAGLHPVLGATCHPDSSIRIDPVFDTQRLRFIVIQNRSADPAEFNLQTALHARGLFTLAQIDMETGQSRTLPAGFIDIFEVDAR
jgi:beta-galactosidase